VIETQFSAAPLLLAVASAPWPALEQDRFTVEALHFDRERILLSIHWIEWDSRFSRHVAIEAILL
jgi:hypothetical protein